MRGRDGQRKDWHGIVSAAPVNGSELLEGKKKQREETGKAYQTGFQITEVIPSVIDSPIATYRISAGSSWEGNYKRGGRETRARARQLRERKKAKCVRAEEEKRYRKERNTYREITKKADEKQGKKAIEMFYYERSFFLSYLGRMIVGLISYYRPLIAILLLLRSNMSIVA